MKIVSYAQSLFDLSTVKQLGITNVIIALSSFSKEGISTTEAIKLIQIGSEMGLEISLEIDSLFVQSEYERVISEFKKLPLAKIYSIRVADIGFAKHIFDYFKDTKIDLFTETMGANLESLKEYQYYFGHALKSVLLSIQLSKEQLLNFCSNLAVSKELLVLGRIPLFFSPRHLLTGASSDSHRLEMSASSEETPHSGFLVVENRCGTVMYHPKDIFLMDKIDDLKSIGIDSVRVDLRHLSIELRNSVLKLCKKIVDEDIDSGELKELYPRKVIRGYYRANRSDVLFSKLKNPYLIKDDNFHIGYVLAIRKKEYLAIIVNGTHHLEVGSKIKLITPEGKEIITVVRELYLSDRAEIKSVSEGLCFIGHVKGVSVKTVLQVDN